MRPEVAAQEPWEHPDCKRAEDSVRAQDRDQVAEIYVDRKDWARFSVWLQEAVNFVRYELLDDPAPGKRGTVVIAVKKGAK
jgi:hypothetical protein